jgi:hypothetical protein
MIETWKQVVGYKGRYEISDQGRLRSLLFRGHAKIQIMKISTNYSGYRVVSLGAKPKKQFRLHCLVLEAFIGPRPEGKQGCHGDNNKDNNALSNLRWDTPSGNMKDRRSYYGSENPRSKLTEIQRAEVVSRYKAGELVRNLSTEFSVTPTRIYQLARSEKAA